MIDQHLELMTENYGKPDWFAPEFNAYEALCREQREVVFSRMTKALAFRAASSIQAMIDLDYIEADRIQRILDFGSMTGEALLAIDQLAQHIGATVVASEIDEQPRGFLEIAISADVYVNVESVAADGLAAMHRPGEFDLIVGSWFGPTYTYEGLAESFVEGLNDGLSAGGVAVVHSDKTTMIDMLKASRTLSTQGFTVDFILAGRLPPGHRDRPHLIVQKH